VISYLRREVGDSYYTPPRILKDMLRAGRLGRKTSAEFYDHYLVSSQQGGRRPFGKNATIDQSGAPCHSDNLAIRGES
jgi:3-hydroxyacyl-CoA dehydrogenase